MNAGRCRASTWRQQQALLDNTLTQVDLLQRARSQFEHAIATLTGAAAGSFALEPAAIDRARRRSAGRRPPSAGAPARRGLGGARDGRRQCADRRRDARPSTRAS